MVEYLQEAKKFIQRARTAYSAETRNQDLDMADWCVTRAIEEARHEPQRGASQQVQQRPSRIDRKAER